MQELCASGGFLRMRVGLGRLTTASWFDKQPVETLGLIALDPGIHRIGLARVQQAMECYLAPGPPSVDLKQSARALVSTWLAPLASD